MLLGGRQQVGKARTKSISSWSEKKKMMERKKLHRLSNEADKLEKKKKETCMECWST